MLLMDVKKELGEVLSNGLASTQIQEELHDDTSLLRDIGLDSVQLIELVVAIEQRFGVAVFDDDLSPDLFDKYDRLCNYILNKVNAR
ncbi:acyl carrier protein [Paenibacillus xylanexedens]|uniref:acyl carrier protein n=2 Tax=Paenibacillus xylanexedens TaxID=528191 RepID=UPI0011A84E34|nr:acyl carrier protein [Paenibacillus xylanexedens]